MVEFLFLKTTSCPICGCRTVISESVEVDSFNRKIKQHCNGGRWEYRTFQCGYKVYYCPNFGHEYPIGKCAFDQDEIERKEKEKAFKDNIIKQIEEGECNENYKDRLIEAIKYI